MSQHLTKIKFGNLPFTPSDPRSSSYPRVLNKPHIEWGKTILRCFLPLAIAVAILCFLCTFWSTTESIIVTITAIILYSFISLKQTLISWVKLYQYFAPSKIRMKCRFEPSCSQYMIMAIEKYGAIKGLIKGMRRLKKCNNRGNGLRGGFDYP